MTNAGTPTGRKGTIVYFSHGGGPLPILGDPSHDKMVRFLRHLPTQIPEPDAIIVMSAHWEEQKPTVLGAARPPMVYDYDGFPDESYTITYPAAGNPSLASRIVTLLEANRITCMVDQNRGFDHGLYIPLMLMYPTAQIPSIQLSLIRGLDPSAHIHLGKALRTLLNENILIIGSGFSFHNMRAFVLDGHELEKDAANDAFQDWLVDTCTQPMDPVEREKRLVEWEKVPSARYCHPRAEHLMPLHVCVGAAGDDCVATKRFDDYIMGKRALAFQW